MTRHPVQSSNVKAIGWEYAPSGLCTVEVEFLSGSVYQYRDVPKAAVDAVLQGPSIGAMFNRYLKAGQYPVTKIAEPRAPATSVPWGTT